MIKYMFPEMLAHSESVDIWKDNELIIKPAAAQKTSNARIVLFFAKRMHMSRMSK